MPNQFYCSKCGVELIYTRRAVPGKGKILDLISPHECEGYAIKSNELEKPTVLDVLEGLKDLGKTINEGADGERHTGFRQPIEDRRDTKVSSTAPASLSSMIKDLAPSGEELE